MLLALHLNVPPHYGVRMEDVLVFRSPLVRLSASVDISLCRIMFRLWRNGKRGKAAEVKKEIRRGEQEGPM